MPKPEAQKIFLTLALTAMLSVVFLVSYSYAEATGTINFTNSSSKTVTGLKGTTVKYCNATADCSDSKNYACFTDFDAVGINSSWQGWCLAASRTSCLYNNNNNENYINVSSGGKVCANNTAYRTCSSGNWSNATQCASGETCSDGNCTSSSSGGSGSAAIATGGAMTVTLPATFDITQGESANVSVFVKNTGNVSLSNVTLSVSGINASWVSVTPSIYKNITKNNNVSFALNFTVPANASPTNYSAAISIATSNASLSFSGMISFRVPPSNATVQQEVIPNIMIYSTLLDRIQDDIISLEGAADQEKLAEIKGMFIQARKNIADANESVFAGRYFEAGQLVSEAADLINQINARLADAKPQVTDITPMIVIIALVAIAALFLFYLMLPPKEHGYDKDKGWLHPPEERKKLLQKLRKKFRKKKKEEPFYEFGHK